MDLLAKGFFAGRTLQLATPHIPVIGKLVLTQLELGTLGRRYDKDFAPPSGTINFKPLVLEVEKGKFEYQFIPQDFRSTYLGAMQQRAFQGLDQIPFEAFVMEKLMEKQAREISQSLWQATKVTPALTTHNLNQIHDGYLKKITDALAEATPVLSATPVPGGAWTVDNIIETLEAMWLTLDDDVQEQEVSVFVPTHLHLLYQQAYRERFKRSTVNEADKRIKLDFGLNVMLVPTPEMGRTTNRVVMTPTSNLHYGMDGVLNPAFEFEQNHRAFDYWYDFQLGVQFGFLEDGVVAVSDLA